MERIYSDESNIERFNCDHTVYFIMSNLWFRVLQQFRSRQIFQSGRISAFGILHSRNVESGIFFWAIHMGLMKHIEIPIILPPWIPRRRGEWFTSHLLFFNLQGVLINMIFIFHIKNTHPLSLTLQIVSIYSKK